MPMSISLCALHDLYSGSISRDVEGKPLTYLKPETPILNHAKNFESVFSRSQWRSSRSCNPILYLATHRIKKDETAYVLKNVLVLENAVLARSGILDKCVMPLFWESLLLITYSFSDGELSSSFMHFLPIEPHFSTLLIFDFCLFLFSLFSFCMANSYPV